MPKVTLTAAKGLVQETGNGTISTPMGIIAPQLNKTAVAGGGAFAPLALVVNTHYLVGGSLNNSALTVPAGSPGDVIIIEHTTETAGELTVANGQAVSITCDASQVSFSANSSVKAIVSAATNGAALLGMALDAITANGTNDNVLTLTGATNAGPGMGTYLCLTREATLWRIEGWIWGSGAQTGNALNTAAFS